MRHHIYLREYHEVVLDALFDYLKRNGEIPTNAIDMGKYRSQVIQFALEKAILSLELHKELTDRLINLEVEHGSN